MTLTCAVWQISFENITDYKVSFGLINIDSITLKFGNFILLRNTFKQRSACMESASNQATSGDQTTTCNQPITSYHTSIIDTNSTASSFLSEDIFSDGR